MSTEASGTGITRRSVLERAGTAAVATTALGFPFIRNAKAAELELRWLGWEHYNVKELTAAFEQEHGVKVSAGFFDGNSEAYNKLRAGGTQDFDLVMADGFWPRLYGTQGLTQPVDYGKLANLENVFPEFQPPAYMLLRPRTARR
jgi:spermidine/putrescine-binding protein